MQPTTITIIYQDHHLLILNKQAGIVVHPTYKNLEGTLWDAILLYLEAQGDDGWRPPELPDEPQWVHAPAHIQVMLREKRVERLWQEEGLLPRPCLLHRLDKDTSGVLALARTARSCRHLTRQFYEHTIVKRYLTVVRRGAPDWARPRAPFLVTRCRDDRSGDCEEQLSSSEPLEVVGSDELILDGPLQRDPDDRRRCIVGPDGQEARTLIRVLAKEGEFFLLEVRLITGRTHQIRAHLAALGYSIVGDAVYARAAEPGTAVAALGRQFLHASSLQLKSYPENEVRTFVAPLADDLAAWLNDYFPSGLEAIYASEAT